MPPGLRAGSVFVALLLKLKPTDKLAVVHLSQPGPHSPLTGEISERSLCLISH